MTFKLGANFALSVRNASTKPTTNNFIKPFLYNRNPRNLERLRLERKPTGYFLDNKYVEYWHRLKINQFARYVSAQVVHNTDAVVVEASTSEWAIRKFLYSATDKQAFIILARVFAERCLESGMTSMQCDMYKNVPASNITAFMEVLENEGIILEEAPYYDIHDMWRFPREKRPWTVLE